MALNGWWCGFYGQYIARRYHMDNICYNVRFQCKSDADNFVKCQNEIIDICNSEKEYLEIFNSVITLMDIDCYETLLAAANVQR